MMRRIALLLVLTIPAMLWATTVIPMDVEKLTAVSTHIVEGRALDSTSQWNSEHTLIFTYTRFQVTRALKGEAPATIVVRQLGGTVDGISQRVAGVRPWRAGEEALLFLQPSTIPDGALVVTGLMQGNFLLRRSPQGVTYVSNGMPDASEYRVASGEVATYQGSKMRLAEMEARIQKAVQK